MRNIKIFILGAPRVGKTSLLHKILFGSVQDAPGHCISTHPPTPTIEDVYFATIDTAHLSNMNNQDQSLIKTAANREDRLMFFDVAGIKQNIDIESLRTYIAYADEFILVYSIDDRSTFNLVDTIKKLIDQSKGKRDHPIIVLGNKVDRDNQRQVDFEEALVWAKREHSKLFEVTSFECLTLCDFTRYLSTLLSSSQQHTTSGFKLRRSKTNQSTSS